EPFGCGGSFRQRCRVMTLTPSACAISLCGFPCSARSFASASLRAIWAFECFVFFALPFSPLRPFLPIVLWRMPCMRRTGRSRRRLEIYGVGSNKVFAVLVYQKNIHPEPLSGYGSKNFSFLSRKCCGRDTPGHHSGAARNLVVLTMIVPPRRRWWGASDYGLRKEVHGSRK